jgi:acyl-coenzyme A thioesterase PaaI-like protein
LPKAQPNSRQCFVCGVANPIGLKLHFFETAPGEVTAECTLPEHYQGYPGVAHGGIVAAMLDEVSGRVFMRTGDRPRFMYTARLEVRYRRNVPVGKPIRLVGHSGKDRGRMVTASGEIYDEAGNLLAECKSLLVDVPAEAVQGLDFNALGWKVYDD